MNVVHVITRMIVGGAQENTLYSAEGLFSQFGHDVTLVTGPETGPEGDLLAGRTFEFPVIYVPHLVRAVHPWSDARAGAELYRLFKDMRPDVVHTHSTKAGVLGRVAAKAAGVPVVVHTLHSLVFHDYQPAAVNFACRTTKRLLTPFTDHYVSVADNIRQRAIAARIGHPDQHSTIRSGFRTDELAAGLVPKDEARRQLGLPQDRVVIGVVARLFPLKGHLDIIGAATRLVANQPDALFVFVGSGPLLEDLQRLVAERGLEANVRFLGRIAPAQMPVAFSAFDILAHASLREGLARVLPQAAVARIPIACYDLDGSSEVVREGVNGFLVAPKDTEALAERLERLVADAALRQRMGQANDGSVEGEFSTEEMVRRLDALYQRLLDATPRRSPPSPVTSPRRAETSGLRRP